MVVCTARKVNSRLRESRDAFFPLLLAYKTILKSFGITSPKHCNLKVADSVIARRKMVFFFNDEKVA